MTFILLLSTLKRLKSLFFIIKLDLISMPFLVRAQMIWLRFKSIVYGYGWLVHRAHVYMSIRQETCDVWENVIK
jgi:hypothetical protein